VNVISSNSPGGSKTLDSQHLGRALGRRWTPFFFFWGAGGKGTRLRVRVSVSRRHVVFVVSSPVSPGRHRGRPCSTVTRSPTSAISSSRGRCRRRRRPEQSVADHTGTGCYHPRHASTAVWLVASPDHRGVVVQRPALPLIGVPAAEESAYPGARGGARPWPSRVRKALVCGRSCGGPGEAAHRDPCP